MSEAITIARPYAKAAFNYAAETKNAEQWSMMLQALAIAAADPNSVMLLHDPNVSDDQVAQLFIDVCDKYLSDDGKQFIHVLAEKGRLNVLPEIAEIFQQLLDDSRKTIHAQVFSPFEVGSEQLDRLKTALQKKLDREVTIETHIDESLLGGALIRAGDLVIDGTLRGRLDRLEDELMS